MQFILSHLEDHFMGKLGVSKREHSSKISEHKFLFFEFADHIEELTINCSLVFFPLFSNCVTSFLVLKMSPSACFGFFSFCLLKYSSLTRSGILTPLMSNFVFVAMTYFWLILLRGQPFRWKGPVTNRSPELSCFMKTTRFPLCLPAKRIRQVPGVMEALMLRLCWLKAFWWFFNFLGLSSVG